MDIRIKFTRRPDSSILATVRILTPETVLFRQFIYAPQVYSRLHVQAIEDAAASLRKLGMAGGAFQLALPE